MIKEPYIFTSILGDLMVGYIEEQRAVGYKYTKGASLLKKLDQLIVKNNLKSKELPKELVYQWTAKRPNETESTQNGRISTVRGFAKYMVRLGYDAYIYPPRALTIERYSYIPYIFSKQEIKKIFDICDNYPISVYSPNRHLVISLILRMLYGCGLRISEAVNLKINDVNLTDGTLTIHNTKFDKSRIVPMSESLNKQCQLYVKEVHQFESKNPYFSHRHMVKIIMKALYINCLEK
ncbi:Site-specific tyrosine recombinase XerC [Candidatus Syntrophocurvum alkaliphilum]|uniref:Site-specific tyrosine recombinase XerC n=1 Tax=Candidatus Syntrophocurvum alkaliphilum TaxID=2293317 RepID=A0A6I6DCB7_9FIRM|nr:site-specific integrase [Candidatus Syntrophocurvum alkaliphilum]QGU00313.1 Site-specific tyrosine recombinase XerC [Candidatus Syntrophocurvum alkaliphilum]